MPHIEVRNVSVHFRRIVALQDVDLDIYDGEYLSILGPSGCGKTTLLRVISGMLKPTTGTVKIDGEDVTNVPLEERGAVGFVFQNIALFPHMKVEENAAYSARVSGQSPEKIQEVGDEVLSMVGMLQEKGYYPYELSGGSQQKVSLARALATQSELFYLDEPISALDSHVRTELRYELRALVKDLGLTALHVTHDQETALSVADRVLVIRAGRVVEVGSPQELYNTPQSLFTANFVGESAFLEGVISKIHDASKCEVSLRHEQKLVVENKEGLSSGIPAVISARPENLGISRKETKNSIQGVLLDKRFRGSFIRYIFELVTEDSVAVDIPEHVVEEQIGDLDVEETAYILFDSINLFERPEIGLSETLKLE